MDAIKEAAHGINPIPWRLWAYGLFCGCLIGSSRMDESTDAATTLGITVFIQITFGGWIGHPVIQRMSERSEGVDKPRERTATEDRRTFGAACLTHGRSASVEKGRLANKRVLHCS